MPKKRRFRLKYIKGQHRKKKKQNVSANNEHETIEIRNGMEGLNFVNALTSETKSENKEQEITQNVENLDVQSSEASVREEYEDTNLTDDIQIKFLDGVLFCDNCHEIYQDYCTNCGMLVHILERSSSARYENKVKEEIPKDLLDLNKSSDGFGIFSLRLIPAGVKFGPFTGLQNSKGIWKIFRGKFVVNDGQLKFPHWLQYINSVRSPWQQNLRAFQYNSKLYYSSVREILEGEELLVHFGEICRDYYYEKKVLNFIPEKEENIENVFACAYCCLGFNSLICLVKHKSMCSNGDGRTSINIIVQCPHCDIYMEQKEYIKCHKNYCAGRSSR